MHLNWSLQELSAFEHPSCTKSMWKIVVQSFKKNIDKILSKTNKQEIIETNK